MSGGFAVQARELRKCYQVGEGELEVLHGLNVDIRRGEFVSIMGPSGSGKSTLLNLLGLLDVPTSGALRIAGHDAAALSNRERAMARREALGFVFQSFNLMPRMDALRNVMLPGAIAGVPRSRRRRDAIQLLERVGLGDRLDHVPSALSGGQKQRVAIARALALNPPILLADEPTGNLDSKTGREIMDLFRELNQEGKTVIQVTHSEEMSRHGDRTIRIRDGHIERDPGQHFARAGVRLPPRPFKIVAEPFRTGGRA